MLKTRLNGTVRPEMDAGLRRGIAAAVVLLIVCVLAVGVVSAADTVTVSSFDELQNNISASGDRTIIVSASFPITNQLPINSGNITLTTDGADHTLSRGNSFTGNLFTVNSGGSLTIRGNSTHDTNLTLDGMKQSPSDSLVKVNGGTFTLADGGILTNNTAFSGGGVYVFLGGTFTMSGGTISDNTANNGYGGGVYVMSDGSTFEMSGGTISGNTADDGGGVYMMSSGSTFEMSGGTISGNTADDGGGVYVMSDGSTFTMSDDAVISENTASNNGGGVYVKSGKFTMSGGEISNNTAEWYGGGVYEDNSGTFGMSGDAVISGNTASNNGGGVCMFGSSTFKLSGSGSTDSVYLASGKSITVTEALTGTENQVSGIELAILDAGTRVVTFESTVSDPANYVSSFTLDSSMGQRVLKYENNALILADAWKVTFDTTGGTPGTYDVLVAKDTPVTKPAAPTMTGYTFTGWYEEEECTNQWDFDTPVTQDMTLYAGWNQDEPGPGPEPVPENLTAVTDKDEYYYEVAEFMDLVLSGQRESLVNSHENSLITLEIIDEVRRQLDIVYPADRSLLCT